MPLPADDSFQDATLGGTAFESFAAWYSFLPDGPTSSTFDHAYLHEGYTAFLASLGIFVQSTACTYTDDPEVEANTKARAFAWGKPLQADVTVRGVFSMFQPLGAQGQQLPLNPTAQALAFLRYGLWARVSGGTTVNNGSPSVGAYDIDGYGLDLAIFGTGLFFRLWRWNAGVSTTLTTHLIQNVVGAGLVDLSSDLGLRMTIQDVGGNPAISCFLDPIYVLDSVTGTYNPIPNFQLFQAGLGTLGTPPSGVTNSGGVITDAQAGKITSGGHCGFHMGRDRRLTGFGEPIENADRCGLFTVNTPAGAQLLNENWVRGQTGANFQVTDYFGTTGSTVQSLWGRDDHALTGISKDLDRGAAQNVTISLAGGTHDLAFLQQRLATTPQDQRQKAAINFSTSGSAPDLQRCGILLRVTGDITTGDASNCYLVYAETDFAGNQAVRVARGSTGSGASQTVLASKEGAALFTEGTEFTLDGEVYLEDGSPTSNGPAVLKVELDGTQVVLLPQSSPVTGIDVLSDGTVIDSSAGKLTSGEQVGFWIYHTGSNWRDIDIDTWTEGDLHVAQTPEDDLASIAVAGEGAVAGSLNDVFEPGWTFTTSYVGLVQRQPFEAGPAQTWPRAQGRFRRWSFRRDGLNETEIIALEDFLNTHDGNEVPFSWTLPSKHGETGETVSAFFVEESLSYVRTAPGIYDGVGFTIEELLEA